MNIGVVVYSQTGNTLSVAHLLAEKLSSLGHTVNLDTIEAASPSKPGEEVQLVKTPDISIYEGLVLAAPVHAFSLSQPMLQYVESIESLDSKTVALLMTQHFPFPWMGGNRALRQFRQVCQQKGAVILGGGIINWSHPRRDQTIQATVGKLVDLFPS